MADIKKLAEELVNLTVKEVNELAGVLKEEYGIEPAAAAVAVAAAPAEGGAAAAAGVPWRGCARRRVRRPHGHSQLSESLRRKSNEDEPQSRSIRHLCAACVDFYRFAHDGADPDQCQRGVAVGDQPAHAAA